MIEQTSANDIKLSSLQARIENVLAEILPSENTSPAELHQAMRYATLGGGKRIRALFTYASGQCFGAELAELDHAAASIELIHAYSLVHDDLPAMDNDDWRRGKPSCHKAFDEATAILVGDALQSLAFETLSKSNTKINTETQLKMLTLLAESIGSKGMAGGQMLDIQNEPTAVETMHALKTGALIRSSILFGAMIANCDSNHLPHLTEFANAIGIAFQIRDDILDAEGDTATLGKTAGIDKINAKQNAVKALGLANSKQRATELLNQAKQSLTNIPYDTKMLYQLAQLVLKRKN